MENNLLLIILRGIPGSGKSTWTQRFPTHSTVVVSTDKFFVNDEGEYIFDFSKLGYNHRRAFEQVEYLISRRVSLIILDNTNIKKRDYKKYVDAAREGGYTVVQKVCTGDYTNLHGVSLDIVERMRETFQEDTELPHFEEMT